MHEVPLGYAVHGHAIVSADDRIADAQGRMPAALRNPADWRRFQAALDAAAVIVLGRLGHEIHPNASGRRRLVVTRGETPPPSGLVAWWNPARTPFGEALRSVAPGGGVIAVPGGMGVFGLFLDIGYDEFHLARAERVRLGDGVGLFPGVEAGVSAEGLMREAGLAPGATEPLDPVAGVTMTIWRPATPRDGR